MRIALFGKGGSGKSTVAALLALEGQARGCNVLAIDADINQNLGHLVGLPTEQRPSSSLADAAARLKTLCAGTNPRVTPNLMLKTTPPGPGSRVLTITELLKELPECCASLKSTISRQTAGQLTLIETGEFHEEDLGTHCYHSKTGSVEILLNHLADDRNELVIVDMTAGVDCFASGLFAKFDLAFLVVEPTFQSVRVLSQFTEHSRNFAVPFAVIGNKILDRAELTVVQQAAGDRFLGAIPFSESIRRSALTGRIERAQNSQETTQLLDLMLQKLSSTPRDYERLAQQMIHFHRRNALDWANQIYGTDLTTQIAPEFTAQLLEQLSTRAPSAQPHTTA